MAKRHKPVADAPVPFGYKIGWFAVPATDVGAIIRAFGLRASAPCTWAAGVVAAYEDLVFVTPPIRGWVLLPGRHWLGQLDRQPERLLAPVLRSASALLGRVQFFASHRVPEYHLWARAKSGQLTRGYCYIGEIGETVWDNGRPTSAELEVGPFDSDNWPNEESVMQVASRWSVNPCEIGPSDGLGLGMMCFPPVPKQGTPTAAEDPAM